MRQLPVMPAVTHMWQSTINNLWFALRAQWPWFVIVAAVFSALSWFGGFSFSGDEAERAKQFEQIVKANPGQFILVFLSAFLIGFIAFSSIAVSWHRYVLLDEVPTGMNKLRVDETVWRYFGNIILISLCVLPLLIPFGLIALVLGGLGPIAMALVFFAFSLFVFLPVIYRLSIKLPAIAIGRRDFKFGDAWDVSRGNWWQIVGVGVVFTIITWGVGLLLTGLSLGLNKVLGPVIGFGIDLVIQVIINWMVTVMGITLLTSLYGFFVEKRDF